MSGRVAPRPAAATEAMQIPDDLPVLTKPFRSADLAARVATLLDGGAEPAT